MRLGTGYLNLQKDYIKAIEDVSKQAEFEILTSSPRANGFYKGGFAKKYIPGIYRVNEAKMLKANNPNIRLYEWESGDWTFHGKGGWLYEDSNKNEVDMTIIGSSNFTYRGNRRDTEAQLYIVAECDHLKKRLH